MPTDPLTRLVDIIQPSLAMYLADSGLWAYPGPEGIRLAVADLVADQRNLLDRAVIVLEERQQVRPRVAYPIAFTGWHDVDLRYILTQVIAGLERQCTEIERLTTVPDDAAAADLATDALRSARQHLDALRDELHRDTLATTTGSAAEPPAATSAAS
jgi:hypothetical protein